MKNIHLKQLINPDRMFRFIARAKAAENELYQDVHTPEQYEALCKRIDTGGYDLIYGNDVDLLEDLQIMEVDENTALEDEFDKELSLHFGLTKLDQKTKNLFID